MFIFDRLFIQMATWCAREQILSLKIVKITIGLFCSIKTFVAGWMAEWNVSHA